MKDERKKEIVREAKRRLKYAPEGRIYINTSHGSIQYLYGKEKSQRKYISKYNRPLIGRLLEKRYNLEVLKAIEEEKDPKERIIKAYENIPQDYKEDIVPFEISDEEYSRNWKKVPYVRLKSDFGQTLIETGNGEKFRSKSEVIIAEMLKARGIPYKYEKQLILYGGEAYPDFTVLNIKQRKEIIWEHFGLMGDSAYRQKAWKKIMWYMENGFILGQNFIFTFEDEDCPFNRQYCKRLIETYLLQ